MQYNLRLSPAYPNRILTEVGSKVINLIDNKDEEFKLYTKYTGPVYMRMKKLLTDAELDVIAYINTLPVTVDEFPNLLIQTIDWDKISFEKIEKVDGNDFELLDIEPLDDDMVIDKVKEVMGSKVSLDEYNKYLAKVFGGEVDIPSEAIHMLLGAWDYDNRFAMVLGGEYEGLTFTYNNTGVIKLLNKKESSNLNEAYYNGELGMKLVPLEVQNVVYEIFQYHVLKLEEESEGCRD